MKTKRGKITQRKTFKLSKSFWIVLGIVILLVLFVIFLKLNPSLTGKAINLNPSPENINPDDPLGVGINPEQIPQSPEEWQNKSTSYLKQEWLNILGNSKYGWIFLGIRDTLIKLDFFWNPVLGVNYSFSWIFIFALAIWFILFFIIYDVVVFISNKKLIRIIAAFCIASLIGTAGVIKKASDLLSLVITNTWIAWVSLVIAVLIMVLLVELSGGLKAYVEKGKEKNAKEQQDKDRQVLHVEAEVAKEELDSYGGA